MKKASIFILVLSVILSVLIPYNYTDTSAAEASVNTIKDYEVELTTLSRVEARTRNAAVKIYTPTGGHGSGTYFRYNRRHIVITAAHVVDEGAIYLVVDQWNNQRVGTLIYADREKDFAVLLIPAFEKTTPMRLNLPNYNPGDRIDTEVIFSGFPSSHSLTTMRGRVSGTEGPIIIIHAAAWMGSSGSAVFDRNGNFLGVLFGVSVGRFYGDPVIMEDFIWVMPYSEINWDDLRNTLDSIN